MFENVFKKLQECIEKNALNFSSVREVVLKESEAVNSLLKEQGLGNSNSFVVIHKK